MSYRASGFGLYTITVGGNVDTSVAGSPIRGYVVRSTSQAKATRSSFATTPDSTQVNARASDKSLAVTTTSYTRVKFDIESGNGSLYTTSGTYYVDGSNVKMDGKNFGANSFSVYTDSTRDVTVHYQPNADTTARIKMEVEGSTGEASKHYVTVFYHRTVTVRRISGNNQFGQENSLSTLAASRAQLGNPLVVRVLDGSRAVPNQVVKFTAGQDCIAEVPLHHHLCSDNYC